MPSSINTFVLRGGDVIDGSGRPRFRADVAITGDRIAEIGEIAKTTGAREVDVTGKIVAPGFIDVHTHDDRALLATPEMAMKASQGVTTVITGNCGVSLAPLISDRIPPPLNLLGEVADFCYASFGDYLAALDASPAALNAACLVGHSTLRTGAMRELDRPAEKGEIAKMLPRLEEALEAGAIGLSTGLYYPPAMNAVPEEVQTLALVLRGFGGALYTTHMRDEGTNVVDSLEETFAVGRVAEVPVVVSHHKVTGRENFGRTTETLPLITAAAANQELGLDVYPYTASSTILDPDFVARAEKVLITWSEAFPDVSGRELAGIASEWGVPLQEAAQRLQPAGAIYWVMDETDVQRVLRYDLTMIGSDGIPHDVHPHPRLWGTFPRVLGHYSRGIGLFTLEEAVRKMTGLPAARFGLTGRGRVAVDAYADITVFDPETVADRATYERPTEQAVGIDHVFVGGRPVWSEGASTGERPGRALRRQAMLAEA